MRARSRSRSPTERPERRSTTPPNGTTPSTSSTKYTGAITISTTTTIKAIATATGSLTSAVATATYTIETPAATPTFTPAAGTYTGAQQVTISESTPGATIFYTTDGTAPTTSSTPYTAAISVSKSLTIKAIASAPQIAQQRGSHGVYRLASQPAPRRLLSALRQEPIPARNKSPSLTAPLERRSTTLPTAQLQVRRPRNTRAQSPSAPPRPSSDCQVWPRGRQRSGEATYTIGGASHRRHAHVQPGRGFLHHRAASNDL